MLMNTFHADRGYSTCRSLATSLSLAKSARSLRLFSKTPQTSKLSQLSGLAPGSKHSSPLVFRSTSHNPYHNLAIEDYLLRNSVHTAHILFFYTNRPCVVIGRNQNPWLECDLRLIQQGLLPADTETKKGEDEDKNDSRIPIDLVRRRSGGGTVFHDEGNLNYSVIVPNDTSFKRAKHAEMVVRALQGAKELDLDAEVKVNERNDIVMQRSGESEWLKISGSAFKLIRGRALHHGTLLYSSPYLGRISALLRSPGRGLITAKGVESVRSKVGNLLWREDVGKRDELRNLVIEAITLEFRKMYGHGMRTLDVGDDDVYSEGNKKVAEGVGEMMTNEWRFSQTPRFDFNSEEGEISFHANRGVVEELSSRGGRGDEDVFEKTDLHLHAVQNWPKTLKEVMGDDQGLSTPWNNKALMEQITGVFPQWR